MWTGLVVYGLSSALMVRGRLGLDPWDVFHQGLSKRINISLGVVVIIVGALVLLGWIPLRERPGFGTISNVVLIGLSLNAFLDVLPTPHLLAVRIGFTALGIAACGLATGMYISVGMGPGPRDGLMTGLAHRTGWSIRLTRTGLEVTVLAVGWLLGGNVGFGTVAFALCIGPASQLSLKLFGRLPTARVRLRRGEPAETAAVPAAAV